MELFFKLLCVHALCDFSLQNDAMAKFKHRLNWEKVEGIKRTIWLYWLGSHSLIHGLGVALITGVWWLGLCETIAHGLIDLGKCEKKYGFHTDQTLHVVCKVLWLVIMNTPINWAYYSF